MRPTNTDERTAKRKKDGKPSENIPTIVVPVDLVGKRVSQHCFENDESDWFEGVVIDINETNNEDPDLFIRYDGYDSLYVFSYHDFIDGNVKLIAVSEEVSWVKRYPKDSKMKLKTIPGGRIAEY